MSSVWETLSKVDVSDHTEEKNGLTYLSWAWAWGEVKNNFPQAKYVKHIWTTKTKPFKTQTVFKLILPCRDAWRSAVQCMVWVTTSTLERTCLKALSRRSL